MDVDRSALATLEDAELRARDRRLEAAAEGERRLAVGRRRAAAIEAGVATSIEEAVAASRCASEERVRAGLAELESLAAVVDRDATPGVGDPAVAEAAELIVAAVLGEGQA